MTTATFNRLPIKAASPRAIADAKSLRSPTTGPLGRLEIRNRRSGQLLRAFYTNTLAGVNLSGVNLIEADLVGANLRCADLEGASLQSADLRGANLSGVNLAGADLSRADLDGAQLRGATYSTDTCWPAGFNPVARGAVHVETPRRPWWRVWN